MKKNNKGETLVETMVSLLVITIVIVGFTTVVTSMAKVNAKIKDARVAFDSESKSNMTASWTVSIRPLTSASGSGVGYKLDSNSGVVVWEDISEGLAYYEYIK